MTMQAQPYHSGEPYYPPTQYAQPQATYYTQFTPYHPHYPPPQNGAPFPVYPSQYYDPALSQPSSPPEMHTPRPRKKHRDRSGSGSAAPGLSAPTRSGTPGAPLKSALKKPPVERTPSAASHLSRQRTNSDPRPRVGSLTRPRSNAQPPFIAEHIFLSLHSINELCVDNIAYQTTLDILRESVLPMWPHGVATEESRDSQWRVRFVGKPWTSTGIDAILAQRLLCRLFWVLASQGYSYLATVNTANATKPARLIFAESPQEPDPLIFLATFSRSADKLTLLDAPQDIVQQLGASLRNVFPRRVASYGANEDGIHVIELKSAGFRTSTVEKSLFSAYILKFFSSAGFKLDGSVPLGRRGALGFGTRKEMWIFRGAGAMRRPESRQSKKQKQ